MRRRAARVLWASAALLAVRAGAAEEPPAPTEAAIALFKGGHYAEARAALERIVAGESADAAACYYLALAVQKANPPSLDEAHKWLKRAVHLDPENETYLAQLGGVTMLLADRDRSLSYGIEGRDAMAKAVTLNPADIDASWGLMLFCAQAPWPFGDPHKAFALAAAIEKLDAKRGLGAYHAMAAAFGKAGRKRQEKEATEIAQKLAEAAAK
jgi:tetratricopeptide (TPR) repeat protein